MHINILYTHGYYYNITVLRKQLTFRYQEDIINYYLSKTEEQ